MTDPRQAQYELAREAYRRTHGLPGPMKGFGGRTAEKPRNDDTAPWKTRAPQ